MHAGALQRRAAIANSSLLLAAQRSVPNLGSFFLLLSLFFVRPFARSLACCAGPPAIELLVLTGRTRNNNNKRPVL